MAVDLDAACDLDDVLKVVAEPMRWRILQLLVAEKLCVCHLVEELDTSQPLVSHHLRVLRDAGLVDTSRHRYWTYYRLRPSPKQSTASPTRPLRTASAGGPAADGNDPRPQATAEAVGTALLVAVVVGSGIFAQRLSTDRGLQLLENSLATAGGLVAPHPRLRVRVRRPLNPVVSLADRLLGGLTNCEFAAYITAQMTGACAGAVIANLMFDLDPIALSTHTRSSGGLWLG